MTNGTPEQSGRWRVRFPDTAYWREQIKCQDACPVHTDARGYVRAIAEGDYERAYLLARGPNPMASICGLICGAPCEAACRRGDVDRPIAIRALKRFVTQKYGPGAEGRTGDFFRKWLRERIVPQLCQAREEMRWLLKHSSGSGSGMVAIVGSGPAGLACAHDLALMGIDPVILEMENEPAGMLYMGVPEYRLSRQIIRAEVEAIRSLGVEIRCGVQVGKDVGFDRLLSEYDAVVVAVGAKRSRDLSLPGAQGSGVFGGVDFLRDVALGRNPRLGKSVVVIGGGNVAYDVGRTVLRQAYFDAARTAARQSEVGEVRLCCLESLMEMPADDTEIVQGAQEGILLLNSLGPKEILRRPDGSVAGVVFQKVLRVYDENGRFAPEFDPRNKTVIACDSVIFSVGQAADLSFIDPDRDGVAMRREGIPEVSAETLAGTRPGVFFAGDVAHGTRLMIDAIASGKKAARSVFEYLTGRKVKAETFDVHFDLPGYEREKGYERTARVEPPTVEAGRRLEGGQVEVEQVFPEPAALRESSRCLDCGVNTIFDSEKCVLCGGCADVCPTLCLRLVSAESLEETDEVRRALESASPLESDKPLSAIIKEEEKCIRCACCARRCPTGAITMERFCFQESLS